MGARRLRRRRPERYLLGSDHSIGSQTYKHPAVEAIGLLGAHGLIAPDQSLRRGRSVGVGPLEFIREVCFQVVQQFSSMIILGPSGRVVQGKGAVWKVGDRAYPVQIGDVDWKDQGPEVMKGAVEDPLAPSFDQGVVVGVAKSRVVMEPLGCQRPKGAPKAPAGGVPRVLGE